MALKSLLLFTLSFHCCYSELPDATLKILLNEILKANDDIKNTVDVNVDLEELNGVNKTASVISFIATRMQDHYNKSETNFSPKQFFGSIIKVESLIERIFEKLVDIKIKKLHKIVLGSEEPHRYQDFLLSAIDVVYNHEDNSRREVEVFLVTRFFERLLNFGKSNATSINEPGKEYSSKLRNSGRSLICVFSLLANLSNNYAAVELLQPFEAVLQNFNTSEAMLLFVNEFFMRVLEANGTEVEYKNLLTNYIKTQLETVFPSELATLENITQDKVQELEGSTRDILDLIFDWNLKMQQKFGENNFSEYFFIMDETFRQVAESKNNTVTPGIGYRKLLKKDITKEELVKQIEEKIKNPGIKNTRLIKMLKDMGQLVKSEKSNLELLQLVDECVDQIRNFGKLNLKPSIFNYIIRKLSTIEKVNETIMNSFREKRVEQIAAILDEFISREPRSIITTALDWLFDIRIQMLTSNKAITLFDILQRTYDTAMQRRSERMRIKRTFHIIPPNYSYNKIKLSDGDERTLLRASLGGMF